MGNTLIGCWSDFLSNGAPNVKLGLSSEAVLSIFLVVRELASCFTELSWLLGFAPVFGSFWLLAIVDRCSEVLIVVGTIFRDLSSKSWWP